MEYGGNRGWDAFSLFAVIVCYPADTQKPKAIAVCNAFADGVRAKGGEAHVCLTIPHKLLPGDAFFYGVRPSIMHLWQQCKAEGRSWTYADNSYFDSVREQQFRITKNRIQHTGRGESDGKRFERLNIKVKPWRTGGNFTLICAQSDEFMATMGAPDWLESTIESVSRSSARYLVRRKNESRSFLQDLAGARKVITWSSAAAITALLEGVEVECSEQCAAYKVTDRKAWAEVLADNQWTLNEMRRGI